MAVKKIQKNRMNASGTFDVIHYETDASQVLMADGTTAEAAIGSKETAGAAAQALADAKSYTDNQIAAIPTPDVSGQINTHNTSETAHADLFASKADLVNGVVPVSQLPNEVKECRIVADIAARDAITDKFPSLNVYVEDATGDPTVDSGGAYYLWNGSIWRKTSESESMDVVLKWGNVTEKPTEFTPSAHTHNQSDVNGLVSALAAKQDALTFDNSPTANSTNPVTSGGVYSAIPTKTSQLTNDSGYITGYTETDPTVPSWAKQATKPTYTASEVGADASGSAASVQSNLNTHTSNSTMHITTDERTAWSAKADKPKAVPVTLTAAGWVDGVQTVAVVGVSADENAQDVKYIYPGASAAAVVAAGLYISATAENSVTFSCLNDTPTADIAVCVEITEINYVAS